MELSKTAYVILGMLRTRAHTGYEIKSLVDRSTRFFWAASYGQIYPELKRLEGAGLVTGTDASSDGGRRRTIYDVTDQGREVAREWISAPPEVFELRDEGLLKLFFAGVTDPARTPEIARERAEHARGIAARLREVERSLASIEEDPDAPASPDAGSRTTLKYGIELNEWAAEWFERAAGELEAGAPAAPPATATTES